MTSTTVTNQSGGRENGGGAVVAVPWTDSGQVRLVGEALKAGIVGRATDTAFAIGGRATTIHAATCECERCARAGGQGGHQAARVAPL